jgi:phosphate starvation-inducible PhoH-like protein
LGAQDTHLEMIKNIIQKKIVARGTTLKALKENFRRVRKRFQRLCYFTRYNNIDNNVIERVIMGDSQDDKRMSPMIEFSSWCRR